MIQAAITDERQVEFVHMPDPATQGTLAVELDTLGFENLTRYGSEMYTYLS